MRAKRILGLGLLVLVSMLGCKKENKEVVPLSVLELEKKAIQGDVEARKKLIHMLENDVESNNRIKAVQAIGNAKLAEANKQLLFALENDDEFVRPYAMYSICQIGKKENYPLAVQAIQNQGENEMVRKMATKGLGYFQSKDAVRLLVKKYLRGDSLEDKKRIIFSLGNTKSLLAASQISRWLEQGIEDSTDYTESYPLELLLSESLLKLSQAGINDRLIKILDKKISAYEFDTILKHLVTILAKSKYKPAEVTLARAYLTASKKDIALNKFLIHALQKIKISQSYAVITANVLNIRKKPNTRSSIAGALVAGEISLIAKKSKLKYRVSNKQDYWYQVKTDGKQGWIFGGFLKILDHNNPVFQEKTKKIAKKEGNV